MSAIHPAGEDDAAKRLAEAKKRSAEERERQALVEHLEEQVRTLTKHTKKLERTIRVFTTSKTLTDEQRAELIGLLTGTHAGRTDATVTGNAELLLIDRFRSMSSSRRRMFTMLSKELAEKGA